MRSKINWTQLLSFLAVLMLFGATPLGATTFTDPVFGWQVRLPDNWKVEALEASSGSISGAPSRAWMVQLDPMNSVVYQIEEADIRNSIRLEEFKKKNFEVMSASMLYTAQKANASKSSNVDQIMVGGQIFDTLGWELQAPNRPVFKSMTLVASMADKALTIGISCTGNTCDTVFQAIDNSFFSNPEGMGPTIPAPPQSPPPAPAVDPVWDFTIPLGWKRAAASSSEEKLSIDKGEGNTLSYSLFADDGGGPSATIQEIKKDLFKDTLAQYQQLAHENNLMFNSEEEVVTLGQYPFQTISIGLLNPDTNEPVMVVGQLLALLNNKLAMILITCVDEQSCTEAHEAVANSSFR